MSATQKRNAKEYVRGPPKASDGITKEKVRSAEDRPSRGKGTRRTRSSPNSNNANMKLRTQLKELNNKLEDAIDKAKVGKKPLKPVKESDPEEKAAKMAGKQLCAGQHKRGFGPR